MAPAPGGGDSSGSAGSRTPSQVSAARVFDAGSLALEDAPPSPLPRRVLYVLLALVGVVAIAVFAGEVDVVAVADGRIVPRTLLKIVQPAESGVVSEILVEEGAFVVAGQPLLRLDARFAEADARALTHEVARLALQLRRIEAELSGNAFDARAGDPADAYRQALEHFRANRSAHEDTLAQARAAVARLVQELSAARAIERKLAHTVPMAQTVSARFDRLRADGFVSELAALDRERERIEREQDLAAQAHTVGALEAALLLAQRQLAGVRSAYRRALTAERSEVLAQTTRLREELAKQLLRHEQIELVAPQAGIVKDLATRTAGSVVAAGTVLVTLVPAGDPLEAEVMVRNDDAGFVRAGQRAEVKVAAFPFQKYGVVAGDVLRVDPDASEPGNASTKHGEAAPPAAYRTRLALATQSLAFEGTRMTLLPGMVVSAEIHLGRRPLVDYLLGPVRKAWHEAARER